MNEYVKKWIKVSENDNFKSTYQIVFGKAVVEALNYFNLINEEADNELVRISMHEIARVMMWLYWKQSFKYNLKQGKGNLKIIRLLDEIIEKFNDEYDEEREPYSKNLEFRVPDYFFSTTDSRSSFWSSRIRQIQEVITKVIVPAFEKCGDENLDLFVEYNDREIVFRKNEVIALREHYLVIKYIYDYKWAQLLARYNEDFKLNKEMIKLIDLRIYQ